MVNKAELIKRLQEEFRCTEDGASKIADKAEKFEPIFEEKYNSEFTSETIVSKMKSSGQPLPGKKWNQYVGSLSFICEVNADEFQVYTDG